MSTEDRDMCPIGLAIYLSVMDLVPEVLDCISLVHPDKVPPATYASCCSDTYYRDIVQKLIIDVYQIFLVDIFQISLPRMLAHKIED